MSAWLVLENGDTFKGKWHGGQARAGEVVFNTSHSGYEEIATDPSYFSQIVCMTAPMMGNYGVDRSFWESNRLWIEGFIALQLQDTGRDHSWIQRLNEAGLPAVSEMDTRRLTLRLRSGGTPWGALVPTSDENEAREQAKGLIARAKDKDRDWVFTASRHQVEDRDGFNMVGPRVAVLDFGSKENILRELQNLSSAVRIFPSRTSAKEIQAWKPDRLMLTNGPGDPGDVKIAVETVRALLGTLPIFGICMGHQILGLALGGSTYKLRFGHRGSNHPIRDEILKTIYMSSQNHGYAVTRESLPADVRITHVNLNDESVAGFYSAERRCLGIQYHPEACPGPHDAQALFRYFTETLS